MSRHIDDFSVLPPTQPDLKHLHRIIAAAEKMSHTDSRLIDFSPVTCLCF